MSVYHNVGRTRSLFSTVIGWLFNIACVALVVFALWLWLR